MSISFNLIKTALKLLLYGAIVVAFITFCPGLPPNHIRFEAYTVDPPMKPEGKLVPNSVLNNVKILDVDREIVGPESIAIRGDELFMGDARGEIVKVKNGKVTTIARLGFPCDDPFRTRCSFPLGMRFDPQGKLVFIDAHGGLLRVDVDTGVVEHLLTTHEVIDGVAIGAPNDLDVAKDGTIYFSDLTTSSTIQTFHGEMFGHPSGRLLKFEPSKNKTTVLMENIHCANGVQLSEKEDFVLVSEIPKYRLRRYYLKGPKKGTHDIFVSGLPGMPVNTRRNKKGGFYTSLYAPRSKFELGPHPYARRFLIRALYIVDYITLRLYNTFPGELTKNIYNIARAPFWWLVMDLGVPNAYILELSENGHVIGSLQSTNSALFGVSQLTVGKEYSYFGTPFGSKLAYIPTKDI